MELKGQSERKLERVGQEIQQWRETRTKVGAMPEPLWEEATAVARLVGVYPVVKACGLNYEALKRRVAGTSSPRESRERKARKAAPKATGSDFIEVSGMPLLSGPPAEGPVVEVVAVDGARLTIRLKGNSLTDVAGLVNAFRERRG